MSLAGNVDLEDVGCPLGCERSDEIVITGRDLLFGLPGEFTVVKCRVCGLMRTNPRPTPKTIGLYYPDNYGPYRDTVVSRGNHVSIVRKTIRLIVANVFKFNTHRLPELPPGRMLEVGCASGTFLYQMAGQGWQVQGIEYAEKSARLARQLGFDVHVGSLETASAPSEPLDLIVGWMVLEHLHDPLMCLKKLKEWARPGATLAISVPNAESLEFKLFRDKWYALQLPTHLYHFTPQTIRHVLQKAGWNVTHIYHHRVLKNLVWSVGRVMQDRGYRRFGSRLISFSEHLGRWNYALYPLAWILSCLGQTGRMTILAQKTDD